MARRRRPSVPKNRGGQLLLEWLERSGWSQEQLGLQVGVTQRTVSRWIDGSLPGVNDAVKVQEIAKVPVKAWGEPVEERRAAS